MVHLMWHSTITQTTSKEALASWLNHFEMWWTCNENTAPMKHCIFESIGGTQETNFFVCFMAAIFESPLPDYWLLTRNHIFHPCQKGQMTILTSWILWVYVLLQLKKHEETQSLSCLCHPQQLLPASKMSIMVKSAQTCCSGMTLYLFHISTTVVFFRACTLDVVQALLLMNIWWCDECDGYHMYCDSRVSIWLFVHNQEMSLGLSHHDVSNHFARTDAAWVLLCAKKGNPHLYSWPCTHITTKIMFLGYSIFFRNKWLYHTENGQVKADHEILISCPKTNKQQYKDAYTWNML
jgi:hypothetical protein